MKKKTVKKQNKVSGTRSPSTDLLCPECNSSHIETWQELEYENANDPTPEYGGKLISVEFHQCRKCQTGF